MILKKLSPLALALTMGLPAYSQIQVFDQDLSVLVPYFGGRWNQGIAEYEVGAEYNIDGRTSLGLNWSKPVDDTLFDVSLKSQTFHPYAIFEFIEPGNLTNFSFSLRADLIYENAKKPKDLTGKDEQKLNSYSRTSYGAGPVFAFRIFANDRMAFVPSLSAQFFYVKYNRTFMKYTPTVTEQNEFRRKVIFHHDYTGAIGMHFKLNEFIGMTFEPKLIAKLGGERAMKELVNIGATFAGTLAF